VLFRSNVAGDQELENYLRQAANLPKRPDYFDTPSTPVGNSDTENHLMGVEKSAKDLRDEAKTMNDTQKEINNYIDEIRKLRKEILRNGD
jgi:hypothetical protein